MLCQIVVMFLGQSYQDILKRGYYIEFTKTAKHVLMVMLLSVLYLFVNTAGSQLFQINVVLYRIFVIYALTTSAGYGTKKIVLKKKCDQKRKEKSMVVVVSLAEAKRRLKRS